MQLITNHFIRFAGFGATKKVGWLGHNQKYNFANCNAELDRRRDAIIIGNSTQIKGMKWGVVGGSSQVLKFHLRS